MARRRQLDILEGGEFELDGEFFPEGEELGQGFDPADLGDISTGIFSGPPPGPSVPPPGSRDFPPYPPGEVPTPADVIPAPVPEPPPLVTGPGERLPSTPTPPTTPLGGELGPTFSSPPPLQPSEIRPPVEGPPLPPELPVSDPIDPGGITLPDSPFPQFLEDALGQLTGGGGATEFGQSLQEQIMGILGRGGRLDDDTANLEFENARSLIDRARRSQTNEARAALAGRGQLSVPGIEQGGNRSTIGRIEERLAPFFSQAVRDISINQGQRADRRFGQALSAGGSLASGGATNLLGAGNLALGQQEFVTKSALDNLDQNRQWNEFLATHGLDREKIMFEMEQGNIESVMAIIQQFLQASQISAGGSI